MWSWLSAWRRVSVSDFDQTVPNAQASLKLRRARMSVVADITELTYEVRVVSLSPFFRLYVFQRIYLDICAGYI